MGGNANAVSVRLFQNLAQGNKWLNVASGANYLNNNIQLWRGLLAWTSAKARGDVSWRQGGLRLNRYLAGDGGGQEISKPPVLCSDIDIDTAIVWSRPQSAMPSTDRLSG